MKEILELVINIAHGIWHHRWPALFTTASIFLAGWLAISSIPDQYQSVAKVHVDTKTVLQPLLKGLAVQQDIADQVTMMTRVLLSQPTLDKVIRDADLDLSVENEGELEKLHEKVASQISVARGRGKAERNLFEIRYTGNSSEESYNVVKALLNVFVEATVGYERDEAVNAQRFLGQQVKEYEGKLIEAENKLAEFKKEHVGLMPGDGLGYYDRLQQAIGERERIGLALNLALRKRNELKRQLQGEEPVFGFASQPYQNPSNSPHDAKIAEYEDQVNKLLIRFTELHPEVLALRENIAELETKKQKEHQMLIASGLDPNYALANDPLQANPVFQTMKISLSAADVEVASLREQHAQQTRRIEKLKANVNRIPEIEAELTRLNRDYESNSAKYHSLLERYESAKLSEEVGRSPDTVSFNIIDPPNVPISPIWPNRRAMIAALIVLCLGAGLGIAFLLYQLKPVFFSTKYLQNMTKVPVWGAVSIRQDRVSLNLARMKLGVFFAVSTVLFSCFVASLIYQDAGIKLANSLRTVVGV